MHRSSSRLRGNHRWTERGFSLMELGIVIAVIAIIATVVLSSHGFLQASRQSKMVELIDTTAKACSVYGGVSGGKLPAAIPNLRDELSARKLIPPSVMPPGNVVNGYRVTAISRVDNDHWSIDITCTDGPNAVQDCQSLLDADPNRESKTAEAGGGTATITFTFTL